MGQRWLPLAMPACVSLKVEKRGRQRGSYPQVSASPSKKSMRVVPVLAGLLIAVTAASVLGQEITFRHAFDKSPLDVNPRPGEVLTPEVREFRRTGQNPYNGKAEPLAQGKKLYAEYCESCHLPDGSGRMGPSLIEDYHVYEQIKNDVGLFEVVYGGGAGAMQPFSKRMTQDEILKVMAHVRTLMKP
jgi:cytochrome c-L